MNRSSDKQLINDAVRQSLNEIYQAQNNNKIDYKDHRAGLDRVMDKDTPKSPKVVQVEINTTPVSQAALPQSA